MKKELPDQITSGNAICSISKLLEVPNHICILKVLKSPASRDLLLLSREPFLSNVPHLRKAWLRVLRGQALEKNELA